jgi:phage shock protein PspC (stress-responsive transcriptional regulator)
MNTSEPTTSSASTAPSNPASTSTTTPADLAGRTRSLYRPTHDRMLAGVASGIARYLHVDVILVRVALVVSVFIGGLGVPLYLACWLLMPEERAVQSIAADFVNTMNDWRQ